MRAKQRELVEALRNLVVGGLQLNRITGSMRGRGSRPLKTPTERSQAMDRLGGGRRELDDCPIIYHIYVSSTPRMQHRGCELQIPHFAQAVGESLAAHMEQAVLARSCGSATLQPARNWGRSTRPTYSSYIATLQYIRRECGQLAQACYRIPPITVADVSSSQPVAFEHGKHGGYVPQVITILCDSVLSVFIAVNPLARLGQT